MLENIPNIALPPSRDQISGANVVERWGERRGAAAEWHAWWTARQAECARGGRPERLAARQGFVLTRAQARDCGLTDAAVRRRVRRGAWWGPRRGVLAVVMSPKPKANDFVSCRLAERRKLALAAAAAALVNPGQTVSGNSAAVLHGVPVRRDPTEPQLTADSSVTMGHRAAMLVRPARLRAAEIVHWFGVPVTSVPRTLVDLARHDRRDGLIAADAALHEGLTTSEAIDRAVRRARGWPGVRRARRTLALASPLAESPLESLTRLRLHDSGLPMPELQLWVGARGSRYRVDMIWPEQRVIIEVDGRVKYAGAAAEGDALWAEKLRQEYLSRLGYTVLRVMWSDIDASWPATLARIQRALGLAQMPSPMV
jgi:very-short-patch-repair endonuclease